jgi:hypothetical protein
VPGPYTVSEPDGEGGCRCAACAQASISYDWSGTGQRDLDTRTDFLDASVGYSCGDGDAYLQWISGDDTSENGAEIVDVRVDDALLAGLWVSSVEVALHAGWFEPAEGSGGATVFVTYAGETRTLPISPGSQSDCASTRVATLTFYEDGTWDLR